MYSKIGISSTTLRSSLLIVDCSLKKLSSLLLTTSSGLIGAYYQLSSIIYQLSSINYQLSTSHFCFAKMAGTTGFEPAISALTGQRVKPGYTTSPYIRWQLADGRWQLKTFFILLLRSAIRELRWTSERTADCFQNGQYRI